MKKPLIVLIAITAAFCFVIIGIFFGRNFSKSYLSVDQALNIPVENSSASTQTHDGKVDINTATVEQLQMLPGIGEVLAQRIIEYRDEHGDFQSLEDLLNVNGIGESKLADIKPRIKIVLNTEPT